MKIVRWYLIGFVSAILCLSWTPLPNKLLAKFEYANAAPAGGLDAFVGVVVLGGHGDRVVSAVELARKHSQLRVLYTHGTAASGQAEAAVPSDLEQFLLDSGIPQTRLLFERSAQSTRENAVLSAQLVGVDITQPWLLVTSAAHMPRAMATFEAVGWNVAAYPVGYRTKAVTDWREFSVIDGVGLWHNVFYEAFAWVEYRVRGWV